MDELTKKIVDAAIEEGMAELKLSAYKIQVEEWAKKVEREMMMYHDIAVRSQKQIEWMNTIQNVKLFLFSIFSFIVGLLFRGI